jgi:hypothetical protein
VIVLLVFLAGLACIVMGVTLISIPAAWITAGAGLIAVAVILAKGGRTPPSNS